MFRNVVIMPLNRCKPFIHGSYRVFIDRPFIQVSSPKASIMQKLLPFDAVCSFLCDNRAFVLDHGIVGDTPSGDLVSVL